MRIATLSSISVFAALIFVNNSDAAGRRGKSCGNCCYTSASCAPSCTTGCASPCGYVGGVGAYAGSQQPNSGQSFVPADRRPPSECMCGNSSTLNSCRVNCGPGRPCYHVIHDRYCHCGCIDATKFPTFNFAPADSIELVVSGDSPRSKLYELFRIPGTAPTGNKSGSFSGPFSDLKAWIDRP